ncbi:helix-turn-helix domain-containing protein (plasmid) [Rhizobium lusitanum]|uniref:helix-turn-helix domain-containing protein n=1 Tax=Rhizobium lusitanum TaxID=293958 RepID=UPI00161A9899|nr:helix-turn-helix domain-containing protein [Rhizobium lusitanum]QND46097.1 helix-turn-helix domain-containing protein [Rhizobium lusitanum]
MTRPFSRTVELFNVLDLSERVSAKLQSGSKTRETQQQIQRKRLGRAYQMLADPNRPQPHIAEVARCHGFSNEKSFFRLFKAELGHTPGETLENMRACVLKQAVPQHRPEGANLPSGWTLPFGTPNR